MSDVAGHDHPPWSPHTSPLFWLGSGVWINQLENAPIELLGPLADGYDWIAVKISHGLQRVFDEKYLTRLAEYRLLGKRVVAWTWLEADRIVEQARLAAMLRREYGLDALIVNGEKVLDGIGPDGKWDSAAFARTSQWLGGWSFDCPLAISPEPRSEIDHLGWRNANAAYMPQAYPLENGHTVADVVTFGLSKHWPLHRIIPLVQAYKTNGQEYPAAEHRRQADECGLQGLVLYPGDAAFDRPAVWRELALKR